ncbi:MAG: 2-phosphosulfolactate phosphatase [Acidobacteriota bacterium]|nr:2-phosphosulfolactate phosphatase [Acidobacteriota bacterium]
MVFDQSEYNVRCEWGEQGVGVLAPASDVVIIVDVLSFSTAVEIAVSLGATVFPYRWRDETCYEYAGSLGAEVADRDNPRGFSLSPSSLVNLPPGARLVLPSPNGSTLSLLAGPRPTLLGCLRNCRAVAESAMKKGRSVAVIPAGERWEDGSLRPCFEDLAGAGALINFLRGTLSPEARAAQNVFEAARENLYERLRGCGSGKEKIHRLEARDVELAAALNVSRSVPVLFEGAFVRAT